MENLLYVTDEMMDYLRGDRDDLHVFTTIGGEEREFFNEREIAHMEDVRNLFLGSMALRTVCLLTAAACLIALFFLEKKNMLRTLAAPGACFISLIFYLRVFWAAWVKGAALLNGTGPTPLRL